MAGVDITTVKELLGHKTLAMTLRYAHPAPTHKIKAVEILKDSMGAKTIQFKRKGANPLHIATRKEAVPPPIFHKKHRTITAPDIGAPGGIRTPDLRIRRVEKQIT